MKQANPPRLRFFENSPGQRHIETDDRYLYAAPEPRYRLGIIGTGTIGQEHMRVATLLGHATIHGIFDSNPHSAAVAAEQLQLAGGGTPVSYDSLDALCSDPDLDAIFICTPNHTHLEILRAAVRSEKPLFLEKPMATTLAGAAEVIKLATAYPAFVQLGLQYRYKAAYVEARHEALQRASLGDIKSLSMSEYRPPFLDKVDQWNKFSANTGGTLVEKCCHYFDLMQLFATAPPSRVFASAGQAVNFLDFDYQGERADISDHAFVVLEYENGVRGNFTLNMFSPQFYEELVIVGSEGRLVASERFDFMQNNSADSRLRIERFEQASTRDGTVNYPRPIEQSGHHGATFFEHMAFVDRLDGMATESATLRDGLWSVITAIAAEESTVSGQAVSIREFVDRNDLTQALRGADVLAAAQADTQSNTQ